MKKSGMGGVVSFLLIGATVLAGCEAPFSLQDIKQMRSSEESEPQLDDDIVGEPEGEAPAPVPTLIPNLPGQPDVSQGPSLPPMPAPPALDDSESYSSFDCGSVGGGFGEVVYANKPVDPSAPRDLIIENKAAARDIDAESILRISNVNGAMRIRTRTLRLLQDFQGGLSLNAVNIEKMMNLRGAGHIVAHQIGDLTSDHGGKILSVGAIQVLRDIRGGTIIVARKVEGVDNVIDLIDDVRGNLAVCGMRIKSIRNVRGLVSVFGGSVDEISDFRGNLVLVGSSLGSQRNVSGKIVSLPAVKTRK